MAIEGTLEHLIIVCFCLLIALLFLVIGYRMGKGSGREPVARIRGAKKRKNDNYVDEDPYREALGEIDEIKDGRISTVED